MYEEVVACGVNYKLPVAVKNCLSKEWERKWKKINVE
jgi:hypothetical protein